MPKTTLIHTNFNSGEFSENLESRVDYEKYRNGGRKMENFVPLIQGGLVRRPGTYWVSEVKTSANNTIIIPFEFSTTQAYVLEFGDQYIRFYRQRGQIVEAAKTITAITNANPAVVTSAAHGFANGDDVFIDGVVGMTQVNARTFRVAGAAANTFQLTDFGGTNINSTGYGVYTSGGTASRVYTITSPYIAADLYQLKFVQSADTLYILHPLYAPRKLTRTSHTSWTLTPISFLDGPYFPTNTTATTITPSATTGTVTLTASAAIFAATDIGRSVRLLHGSTWGWATITVFTSTTVVTAVVTNAFGAATATANWRLGLFSATTGYPSCAMFYEDRLFLAGTTATPQRLDGSKSGDYENFAPTSTAGVVANDNAVAFTLNADHVNVIRWMMNDDKGLQVGTVGGEWQVRPSSTTEALSPTNIRAALASDWGSENIQAQRSGSATIFVQRGGKQTRELVYNFQSDGLRSPDLNVLADHMLGTGVVQLDIQRVPTSIVWFVRDDGQLLGMTYDRAQDVVGWHRHIVGGTFIGGDAIVESIAVIPSPGGASEDLWLLVRRTINGRNVRYVEYVSPYGSEKTSQADSFYVDCGLTYNGAPTTVISGAWHLEGQTVEILANGAVHPARTVTNGSVTLTAAASKVHLGFVEESAFQTMRPNPPDPSGTSQGKLRRISRLMIRFINSLGVATGPDEDNLTDITFRTTAVPMGQPPPLFTGDHILEWEDDVSYDGFVYIEARQGLPVNIGMMVIEINHSG